jgi:hypothetical protein
MGQSGTMLAGSTSAPPSVPRCSLGGRTPASACRRQSLVVVVLLMGWTAWVVQQGYFYADDYLNFRTAQLDGLTWRYVTSSLFGHFVIGYRIVDWFFATQAPYDFALASVVMVLGVGALLWCFSRVLVQLIGPRPAVSVLTGAVGTSMLLTPMLVWWAAYLDTVGQITFTLVALWCFLRFDATRRWPYVVGILAACTLGLGFYETLLLAPVFAVVLCLVHLDRERPLVERLRRLLGRWPAWVAYALPCGLYLAYDLKGGYQTGSPPSSLATKLDAFKVAWFKGIGPTFVGIDTCYRTMLAHPWLSVLAGQAVFVLAVVLSWRRDQQRTLRALLLLAVAFALYFGPQAFVRVGTFGPAVGVNYLYLTSFAWILPLCAALAWFPAPSPESVAASPPRASGRAVRVMVALAVAWFALAIHGQWAQARSLGTNERQMRAFVANMGADAAAATAAHPEAYVFDTTLPEWLAPSAFYPWNLLSESVAGQLPSLRFSSTPQRPTSASYQAASDGHLVRATFDAATGVRSAAVVVTKGSFCLPGHLVPVSVEFRTTRTLPSGSWMVLLRALSGSVGTVWVSVGSPRGALRAGAGPLTLPEGTQVSEAMLPQKRLDRVVVTFSGGAAFCGHLAVGRPMALPPG